MYVINNDIESISKFDTIVRGMIDVNFTDKEIWHEQHTSHWKSLKDQVKKAFITLYPEFKSYTWRHVGPG